MTLPHIDHINIVVKDLQAAIDFFEMLGFEKTAEKELEGEWIDKVVGLEKVRARFASMKLPGGQTVIELLTYHQPQSSETKDEGLANGLGYRHVGIQVDDLDGWHNKITEEGVECFSNPQDVPNYKNKRLFYFRGPENIIVEFLEYR